jgi:tetratricopeptide (TPR) repeat protein
VYIQLGDYWVEKNVTDVSEAIKSYEKATELDKTSTRALLRQGQMWVRVQNYEDGLKFYKQAIQLDSTFAPAYRYRGDLYLKYARYKQAIADFRKYLSMNDSPSAREQYIRALFNSKNYKDGIEEMKTLMKRDSVNPYMIRLEAYLYYETGDYAKGISAMENFLKKQKVNDKPKLMVLDYSYYGKLLSKNGSDSLGILQIKRAIELDPMSPDAYGDIAAIYFKGKRFADAAAYYELKIKNSPKVNVLDYSSLGQAYYSNKEYVKADTAFTHILAAYPVYGNAWRGRANYKQENQEKPEGKAKPFYELAICKAGTDIERNKKDLIEAYSYLGFYYFVQKNYACSKQAWMKVQEIDATNEKAKSAMEDKNIKATTGSCELIKCL